jgi:hypothetical protein
LNLHSLGLRIRKLCRDGIVDDLVEGSADHVGEGLELDGDQATAAAHDRALYIHVDDGAAQTEFHGDGEVLALPEQALVAVQLHAAQAPILNGEGLTADYGDAAIHVPARMAAASGFTIVADASDHGIDEVCEHRESFTSKALLHVVKNFSNIA